MKYLYNTRVQTDFFTSHARYIVQIDIQYTDKYTVYYQMYSTLTDI